ncbi:hypothetical protein G7K_5897-t1 [Saitoella complicata NRRL Y-17804]|uniref:Uncharacterized protein n=1 Tax=Saitoella complicata (strain BCRC 22490 / CBS 7301 / JCM 7358 / NBRC 10748 / NRRL Y-17804) TaxID=698492 RepID=A0A0E9NQ34_SAICN|nr:hypothetical protein G7K_5897-t1 [Saitoella complicata NRRL Y-17804]
MTSHISRVVSVLDEMADDDVRRHLSRNNSAVGRGEDRRRAGHVKTRRWKTATDDNPRPQRLSITFPHLENDIGRPHWAKERVGTYPATHPRRPRQQHRQRHRKTTSMTNSPEAHLRGCLPSLLNCTTSLVSHHNHLQSH